MQQSALDVFSIPQTDTSSEANSHLINDLTSSSRPSLDTLKMSDKPSPSSASIKTSRRSHITRSITNSIPHGASIFNTLIRHGSSRKSPMRDCEQHPSQEDGSLTVLPQSPLSSPMTGCSHPTPDVLKESIPQHRLMRPLHPPIPNSKIVGPFETNLLYSAPESSPTRPRRSFIATGKFSRKDDNRHTLTTAVDARAHRAFTFNAGTVSASHKSSFGSYCFAKIPLTTSTTSPKWPRLSGGWPSTSPLSNTRGLHRGDKERIKSLARQEDTIPLLKPEPLLLGSFHHQIADRKSSSPTFLAPSGAFYPRMSGISRSNGEGMPKASKIPRTSSSNNFAGPRTLRRRESQKSLRGDEEVAPVSAIPVGSTRSRLPSSRVARRRQSREEARAAEEIPPVPPLPPNLREYLDVHPVLLNPHQSADPVTKVEAGLTTPLQSIHRQRPEIPDTPTNQGRVSRIPLRNTASMAMLSPGVTVSPSPVIRARQTTFLTPTRPNRQTSMVDLRTNKVYHPPPSSMRRYKSRPSLGLGEAVMPGSYANVEAAKDMNPSMLLPPSASKKTPALKASPSMSVVGSSESRGGSGKALKNSFTDDVDTVVVKKSSATPFPKKSPASPLDKALPRPPRMPESPTNSLKKRVRSDAKRNKQLMAVTKPPPEGYWIGRFVSMSDKLSTEDMNGKASASIVNYTDPDHPFNTGMLDGEKRQEYVLEYLKANCGSIEARASFEAFKQKLLEHQKAERDAATQKASGQASAPKKTGNVVKEKTGVFEKLRKKSRSLVDMKQK